MIEAEQSEPSAFKILIVEDIDHKFVEVLEVLQGALSKRPAVIRARTVVEAERLIEEELWDLILLDISMDIAFGSAGPTREGHANLGGMDIIEKMFLLEREMPTIIVTGFDYFLRGGLSSGPEDSQTFADLQRKAHEWIGDKLLGCVRYGVPQWKEALSESVGRLNT